MSNFFNADKASRNDAFHFDNVMGDIDGSDTANMNQVYAGDQGARLHPVPANLGTKQKVGNPLEEPSPELHPIEDPRVGPLPTAPQIVRQ